MFSVAPPPPGVVLEVVFAVAAVLELVSWSRLWKQAVSGGVVPVLVRPEIPIAGTAVEVDVVSTRAEPPPFESSATWWCKNRLLLLVLCW